MSQFREHQTHPEDLAPKDQRSRPGAAVGQLAASWPPVSFRSLGARHICWGPTIPRDGEFGTNPASLSRAGAHLEGGLLREIPEAASAVVHEHIDDTAERAQRCLRHSVQGVHVGQVQRQHLGQNTHTGEGAAQLGGAPSLRLIHPAMPPSAEPPSWPPPPRVVAPDLQPRHLHTRRGGPRVIKLDASRHAGQLTPLGIHIRAWMGPIRKERVPPSPRAPPPDPSRHRRPFKSELGGRVATGQLERNRGQVVSSATHADEARLTRRPTTGFDGGGQLGLREIN